VSLQVSSQQSRLAANPIQAEDEVRDGPDQGHKANETHPRDGGTRITLPENRVPSRQRSEKKLKSDGNDIPEVVQHITNSQHLLPELVRSQDPGRVSPV
jgi:hypothetical protein